MSQEGVFWVRSSPIVKRFLLALMMGVALVTLATLLPSRPEDAGISNDFPKVMAWVIGIEFVIIALLIPRGYEVGGGALSRITWFGKRPVRFAFDERPVLVPTRSWSSDSFSIYTRDKSSFLQEVDDVSRIRAAVNSLIPPSSVPRVPMRAEYRGFWKLWVALAVLLALPPLFIIVFAAVFAFSVDAVIALILIALFTPVLLIALLYGIVATNVRVTRDGTKLTVVNIWKRPKRTWNVTADPSAFLRIGLHTCLVSHYGSFVVPVFVSLDRALIYDVFAISSGNYEFVDE